MNDQIVEINGPGLAILLCCPAALAGLDDGGDYLAGFPDGKDLVDYVNECRIAALGIRWPTRAYRLHFSSRTDPTVVSRASDHVRLGLQIVGGQLWVCGSDDLGRWTGRCASKQIVSVDDGLYGVTACGVPQGRGPVRIHVHLAAAHARPELGYAMLPHLHLEPSV